MCLCTVPKENKLGMQGPLFYEIPGTVFRIRSILRWRQFQILGSVHFYTGLRIRILLFSSVASKMPTKNEINMFFSIFLCFFCLLHSVGTIYSTSFFKDNKPLKSHKTVEIKVFLKFYCQLMEFSGSRSWRLKNVRILRIRIQNTARYCMAYFLWLTSAPLQCQQNLRTVPQHSSRQILK
jgi:hypothetical protein